MKPTSSSKVTMTKPKEIKDPQEWENWIDQWCASYFESFPSLRAKELKVMINLFLQEHDKQLVKRIEGRKRDRKDEHECIRNDKHSWESEKIWTGCCIKCGADRFGITRFNDGYNQAITGVIALIKGKE